MSLYDKMLQRLKSDITQCTRVASDLKREALVNLLITETRLTVSEPRSESEH